MYTPSGKKVVIGRKNICNLVRKENIKDKGRGLASVTFFCFFNIFLSHLGVTRCNYMQTHKRNYQQEVVSFRNMGVIR